MDLSLQGKVAMVTGGSHGLGKQAADSLAREGCKVAICARGQENLDTTVTEGETLSKEESQDVLGLFETQLAQ